MASFVLWRGVSALDNKTAIAAVLVLDSTNRKMTTAEAPSVAQLYIILDNVHPVEGVKTGQDAAICGSCPHRYLFDATGEAVEGSRTCYVGMHSVAAVYKATSSKPLTPISDISDGLSKSMLRIGAYGDPLALPFDLVDELCNIAGRNSRTLSRSPRRWTGYTHAWRREDLDPRWSRYVMASCDTVEDVRTASALGWRCFYVANATGDAPVLSVSEDLKLRRCLSDSSVKGASLTPCSLCRLCYGKEGDEDQALSVFIERHGNGAVKANFARRDEHAMTGIAPVLSRPTGKNSKNKRVLPVLNEIPAPVFGSEIPSQFLTPHASDRVSA